MAICTKKVEVTIKELGENAVVTQAAVVLGVTDIPALGASPEKIDVTTLADESRKYINGIKDYGDLEFSCIFEEKPKTGAEATKLYYEDLRGLEVRNNDCEIKIKVPASTDSYNDLEINFTGKVAVALAEFAVNAAVTFTMSIALSSEIATSVDPKQEEE